MENRKKRSKLSKGRTMSREEYFKFVALMHFTPEEEWSCVCCSDYKAQKCEGRGFVGDVAVELCLNELNCKQRQGGTFNNGKKEVHMLIHESLDGVQHVHLHGENDEDLEEVRKMLISTGMQEEWEVRR